MGEIERVAAAREVVVVAGLVRQKPIIRGIVDAAEVERWTEVIAFRGMIVDDVQDDLDAGVVQPRNGRSKRIERRAGSVTRLGREEAQRVVAPIVGQSVLDQMAIVDEGVDRKELERGDAQLLEMGYEGGSGESAVRPAPGGRDILAQLRQPIEVR